MFKTLSLLALLFGFSLSLAAGAPTYGKLTVTEDGVTIYEGASAHSKAAGSAESGDVFELRGDKLYNGFYKIQFGKKICFILGDQVKLQKAAPTAQPTSVKKEKQDDEEKPKK